MPIRRIKINIQGCGAVAEEQQTKSPNPNPVQLRRRIRARVGTQRGFKMTDDDQAYALLMRSHGKLADAAEALLKALGRVDELGNLGHTETVNMLNDAAKPCEWSVYDEYDSPDTYAGTCGVMWTFDEGDPKDNEVNFCPKCGRKILTKGKSWHQ
jgi:DNA-directed RNA polymerase subunit RPC12/RpoP